MTQEQRRDQEFERGLRDVLARHGDGEPPERLARRVAAVAATAPMRRPALRLAMLVAPLLGLAAALVVLVAIVAGPGLRVGAPAATPEAAAAVAWESPVVSLTARDLELVLDGQRFPVGEPVSISSDPGFPTYQTLELIWFADGVEMRINVYLYSDGQRWWSNQIRTYDGRMPGDWVGYEGRFFESPVGQPYRGDLDVAATGPTGVRGELHLRDIVLRAFTKLGPAAACADYGWPATAVSCGDAAADVTGGAPVSRARIWLTTLAAAGAALGPDVRTGADPSTPVWVLVYDGLWICCTHGDPSGALQTPTMQTTWLRLEDATGQRSRLWIGDWSNREVPQVLPALGMPAEPGFTLPPFDPNATPVIIPAPTPLPVPTAAPTPAAPTGGPSASPSPVVPASTPSIGTTDPLPDVILTCGDGERFTPKQLLGAADGRPSDGLATARNEFVVGPEGAPTQSMAGAS